jgi:hypothetical protein
MKVGFLYGLTVDFGIFINRQSLPFGKIECFFEIFNDFKINFHK